MPDYVTHLLEWSAAALGIVSVALLARGNGRGWSIGAVMVVLTGAVYWQRDLYGSAGLQVMFLFLQALGWWRWKRGDSPDLRVTARRLTREEMAICLTALVVATLLLGHLLKLGGGEQPRLDGFVTAGSLLAQALMVMTVAEAWLLWTLVDLFYIALSLRTSMWAFAGLYLVFTGLAVQGWREWTRDRCLEQRNAGFQEERQ